MDDGRDRDEVGLSARVGEHFGSVVEELERRVLAGVEWPYATVDSPAAYRRVVRQTVEKLVSILADGEGPLWERLAPEHVLLAERLPTSIRDLLDDPGSVAELYEEDRELVQEFAHVLDEAILDVPPPARKEFAEQCRRWSETKTGLDAMVCGWHAELAEDEVLAAAVFEALPVEVRRTCEEWRERSKVPLRVTAPDAWWRCDACCGAFEAGEANVVVAGQTEELSFCGGCVGRAAEGIGGATG